jgi:homotetrameric cytidine deaminase
MDINWEKLHSEAKLIMKKAYAPYSKFPVGVAALVSDGRIISGCNVENASYGLGLCAECGLVSNLIASGGGRLIAAVCVDAEGNLKLTYESTALLITTFEFGVKSDQTVIEITFDVVVDVVPAVVFVVVEVEGPKF